MVAAMVAARFATLEPSANLPKVGQADAAKMLNVSTRTVASANAVRTTGTPELVRAVEQGAITVSVGAKIAKMEPEQQRQILVNSETKGAGLTSLWRGMENR